MQHRSSLPPNPNEGIVYQADRLKRIWLAGGCFWGTEAYMSRIRGVAETEVGYANGNAEVPSYSLLKHTGHAETVRVSYDPAVIPLSDLLDIFFTIIDPTSLNRQGGDMGRQYRTGIYYETPADLPVIQAAVARVQMKYEKPVVTEVLPLVNYFPAEDYHQKYLEKNPEGYCHVDFSSLPKSRNTEYTKPSDAELKQKLSAESFHVIRENGTERPFENAFWDHHQKGIYVDIATGQPLFVSSDKFDSGCGWPSFSRPVEDSAVYEKTDGSFGMRRTEVRSEIGDSHLGHVFTDGPKELGGLRYCINSAALRFIPLEQMKEEGYEKWIKSVK